MIEYGNEPWAISEVGAGINKNQPDNIDLMKLQKEAWGNWDTILKKIKSRKI